ncbi:MAG: DNA polymerase III subunit alpha [Alphaproteobacteria bacterium]|nr:MAG: DNA polymerase III subunit alpha [Alphaproteobacteria bacterium]
MLPLGHANASPQPFIHLMVHSSFSLAEGAIHPSDLIDWCVTNAMPAVGLGDTGNLFGVFQFSQKAIKKGIQPIIGCKLPLHIPAGTLTPPSRTLNGHVFFLCKNEAGYRNLTKLSSLHYRRNYETQEGTLLLDDLVTHAEGLIVLPSGDGGILNEATQSQTSAYLRILGEKLLSIYDDNIYINIERHGFEYETISEPSLLNLAGELAIPLVATNESFFINPNQQEAHDALLCIADGRYVSERDRRTSHPSFSLKSASEMAALFADLPEAITHTITIAKRCGFAVMPHDPMLPPFPCERSEQEELRQQALKGLDIRLKQQVFTSHMTGSEQSERRKLYEDRLLFELNVINTMGFPGYFLIVADFITWAKTQGIPVGPGRGSGAGSVVAWALTITDPDPIRFSLLFERFLNPERVSLPDFDIDFCQERRDEVINYVRQKYGSDRVAQIITFGKLQARAVVRDVGRVLQMPYGQVDRLSKLIPNNPAQPVTLKEAIAQEPKLREEIENDETVGQLMKIGQQLEGLYRHASTHAAGVVIGGKPLDEVVGIYYDPKTGTPATQFSMKDVESIGLLKFDFLGLKTLTVLKESVGLVAFRGMTVDLEHLPLDDTRTYKLLQAMETIGVFQLEGAGMRETLGQVKPDRIEDIIAIISLYRPGPMDNIPKYVACKHGREKPDYLHPMLSHILKETFGVIIYQEQVMEIAKVLSGYTLGGADLLRRAMGKKIKSEMDTQRQLFVDGAKNNGVPQAQSSAIFDQVAKFAGYGFNKSHATAYALIAYQTAYMKANYPVEFMAATMTHDMHNTDKLANYRQELSRLGVGLSCPDVNTSYVHFGVGGDTKENPTYVRYALAAVKNVGASAMQALVSERRKNGKYKSLADFCARVDARQINKRQLESLILAGGFDSLHPNRHELIMNADRLLAHIQAETQFRESPQQALFEGRGVSQSTLQLVSYPSWSNAEKLKHEMIALGFYLSSHPLEEFAGELKKHGVITYAMLVTKMALQKEGSFRLAGVLSGKKERLSKRGNRFAFTQFSDESGSFETTLFAENLEAIREDLIPGHIFVVDVTASVIDEQIRLTTKGIRPFESLFQSTREVLTLRCSHRESLLHISATLSGCKAGKTQIIIHVFAGDHITVVQLPGGYTLDTNALSSLARHEVSETTAT